MNSYMRVEICIKEYQLLYKLMKISPLKASPEIDSLVPIVSHVNIDSSFLVYDYDLQERTYFLTELGKQCRLYFETPAHPDSSGSYIWNQVYYLDIPVSVLHE